MPRLPVRPVIARRMSRLLTLVACLAALPGASAAQTALPAALAGEWVRVDSNYDPNNQMRIRIDGSTATLLFVPPTGHEGFQVGQALWTGISSVGKLRVLGSDARYYPATLQVTNPDEVRISVEFGAEGNAQRWRRVGPPIDGDWMRLASGDLTADGMRIRVTGNQAVIRFLPPAAPRSFRVGSQLWTDIRASGGVQVLGADGVRAGGTLTLEGTDRLWMDGGDLLGRQYWVRPSIAAVARAPVCAATSEFAPQRGVRAGWKLSWPAGGDAIAEPLGLLDYGNAANPPSEIPIDLERVSFPTLGDGFSVAWQRATGSGTRWEEARDLSAAEFAARNSAARDRGFRLLDFEAYETPAGLRYAGIWVENPEGLDWWSASDLTDADFSAAYDARRTDYRLTDIESYLVDGQRRFAGIWIRSCDALNWRQWRNITRAQLQQRVDSLTPLGFAVIDVESYRTPAGQRYAAIWEKRSDDTRSTMFTGRTLPAFLNEHRRLSDLGYLLLDFEAYQTENGLRYAGVWRENEPRHRFALRRLVDDSVQAYRDRFRIPGISVAVIRNGELIYSRGFGWADSARGIEAHARTVYPTASISKAMAGTLGAILESRGVLDLSRPTADYLDSLPAHHTHRVQQLLSKTACVPHYDEGIEPPQAPYARQIDALRTMWTDSLLSGCTPDSAYHYSTHGFTYVGAVFEAVTGKTVAQLVDDEFARPLGLRSLKPSQLDSARDYHVARRYQWDSVRAQSRERSSEDASWKILGGGLQVDAVDLARWGWAHQSGRLLPPAARDGRLWRSRTTSLKAWSDTSRFVPRTALGWEVGPLGRVAEHGGTAVGARTDLAIYPTENLVVAIMTNQQEDPNYPNGVWDDVHWPSTLSRQIERIVRANPP